MHIPSRLGQDLTPLDWTVDFSSVFLIGLFLACIYLRTGNLFLAIGLHALIDAPTSLFISADISKWLIFGIGLMTIIFWSGIRKLQPGSLSNRHPSLNYK